MNAELNARDYIIIHTLDLIIFSYNNTVELPIIVHWEQTLRIVGCFYSKSYLFEFKKKDPRLK